MPRHPVIAEDLRAITAPGLPWERLKGLRVLVTGAGGFLPAYMVQSLLQLNDSHGYGIQVQALVRDPARAAQRFAAEAGRSDLSFIQQDLGAPLGPLPGADIVIHAASQASPRYFDSDPVGTLKPNVLGTAALLDKAREWGSRGFLYFSSGEVYGQVDAARMPIAEDAYGTVDPLQVRSCYAESKRMGEALCAAWTHQYGLSTRIVRPFHTYGPGMRLDDGRIYADLVADVLAGRDLVLRSDGSALRAFCYLADAVRGFFTVLLQGADGQAYNIANEGAEISILQLAERLAALQPERGLKVLRQARPAGDAYLASPISRSCPSTAKARALGWAPQTGIDEGFTRTLRSFA